MKWLKKHKNEIISCTQVGLFMYMVIQGFWFTYLWIWFKVGLPVVWWSLVVCCVLAILSTFGLCQWVATTGRREGE